MDKETMTAVACNSAWMGATLALLMKEGMSPNSIEPKLYRVMRAEAKRMGVPGETREIAVSLVPGIIEAATNAVKTFDELCRKIIQDEPL